MVLAIRLVMLGSAAAMLIGCGVRNGAENDTAKQSTPRASEHRRAEGAIARQLIRQTELEDRGMIEQDEEFLKSLHPGSVLIRPERDAALVEGRDSHGHHVVDPRTGAKFYNEHIGHMDQRGQYYLRDSTGAVIFWGNYRTTVTKSRTLVLYIQTLFRGSGRSNQLDPVAHDLSNIPAMYCAYLELISGSPSGHDTIIVDERRYWFERGNA